VRLSAVRKNERPGWEGRGVRWSGDFEGGHAYQPLLATTRWPWRAGTQTHSWTDW
jgi:hypothetical protein